MTTIAMTHVGYLIAGWGITFTVLGLYSISLVRRGRALSTQVPAGQQRWIDTDE